MDKGIELTTSQIKAFENGATMFLFPLDENKINKIIKNNNYDFNIDSLIPQIKSYLERDYISHSYKKVTKEILPVDIGDKDIFVKEEFKIVGCKAKGSPMSNYTRIAYSDHKNYNKKELATGRAKILPGTQMTKEQSRYSFSKCLDIEVIKIKDIVTPEAMKKIIGSNCIDNKNNITIEDFHVLYSKFKKFYNQQMKELNLNKTYEDNDYVFFNCNVCLS